MAKEKLPKRMCKRKNCANIFTPKRRDQVYCSSSCREMDYEDTYFAKNEVEKVCLECEALFTTTKPSKQWFCSPDCRAKNQKKRRDGAAARKYAESLTSYGERYATFEKDRFRCTACGRGAKDVALDVEMGEDGQLHTMCVECRVGRQLTKGKEKDDEMPQV